MLIDDALAQEIETAAVEMARSAGDILAGHFGKQISVEYKDKDKRDPVTEVDKACQAPPRLALEHPPRASPSAAAQPAVEPEPAPALEGVVRGGVVPRIPASRYVADFGARVFAATGALQSASPAAFAAGQTSPLPGRGLIGLPTQA